MKKKIFSILAIFITLAMLVACTPNTTSYIDATNKVNSWKGSKVNGEFNYDITVKDPESSETLNMKFPVTFEGKQEGKDKAEVRVKMDLKTVKDAIKNESTEEDIQDIEKLPDTLDMNVFVNKDKIYLQKDLFEFINADAVKDIKEDYIAISTGEVGENTPGAISPKTIEYLNSEEFKSDLMNLLDVALGDFKPTIDYKVDGNTYTFNATSDEIIDNVISGSDEIVKNWDKVSENVLAIATKIEPNMAKGDKDAIKNLKNEYDAAKIKESAKEIKGMLKGSKISEKSTFGDDNYKSEMDLTFNINDFVSVRLNGHATQTKDESIKIAFPTSAKEITMAEYMDLLIPDMGNLTTVRVNGEDITFDDPEALPKVMNNRTMLGARSFYEKIGVKVDWNDKARTVTVTKGSDKIVLTIDKDKALVNGKEKALDSPAVIVDNKTYIPVRFVSEAFGYNVKYTEDEIMPIVDIYNISEEELTEKLAQAEKEDNYTMVAAMLKEMDSDEVEKQIKEMWEGEDQAKLLEAKKELESNKELLEKYQAKLEDEIAEDTNTEAKESTKAKEEPAEKVEDSAKKAAETLFAVVR